MQELEKKLNYTFRNQQLLREALNHSSYANENRRQELVCNERLEFLGDSVLSLAVSTYIYKNYKNSVFYKRFYKSDEFRVIKIIFKLD